MDALNIERAHFVGNSMGGQVAMKLAIDAPERVDNLVVIGSNPVSYSLFTPMPLEGIKHIAGYYRTDGGPSLDKMRLSDPDHPLRPVVPDRRGREGALRGEHRA